MSGFRNLPDDEEPLTDDEWRKIRTSLFDFLICREIERNEGWLST